MWIRLEKSISMMPVRTMLSQLILILLISSASARILTIHPDSVYTNITNGIEAANAYDTLLVHSGTYFESNIKINIPITIIGMIETIVDANNSAGIFTVTAPHVTIKNLHLTGVPTSFTAEYAAILLEGVNNVIIENNQIDKCFFGIYAANSYDCVVRENVIIGNQKRLTTAGNGIHLWYCRNITIIDNNVITHRDGIYMEFVRTSIIDSNTCQENLRYGLHFMFSDSCEYGNNTFQNNTAGVAVMYTSNVTMHNNSFENSWGGAAYGLLLKDISDSRVTENRFINNSIGIHIEGSNRVQLLYNLFKENGWAMKIMSNCLNNTISANDFINNSFTVATNSRQNNSHFQGNYWSVYRGIDLDRDGYGDMPFRPVNLFSLLVESYPPTLVLLRSLLVDVLDLAERTIPTLTPETLVDKYPRMRPNL